MGRDSERASERACADESWRLRGHHAQCQPVAATKPSASVRYVYPCKRARRRRRGFVLAHLPPESAAAAAAAEASTHPLSPSSQPRPSVTASPIQRRSNWFLMVSRRPLLLAPKRRATWVNKHNGHVSHSLTHIAR